MRRVLVLAIVIGFVVWRGRRLDGYDRDHGFGAYAPVRPADAG